MEQRNGAQLLTINRRRATTAIVVLIWSILAVRLVCVQWVQRDGFHARAQHQQTWSEPIPARPGDLLDREGRLLATTVQLPSLFVNPSLIDQPDVVARSLASAVGIDAEALRERLAEDASREFLWVKRRLNAAEEQAVRDLALPPAMWGFRQEFQRRYPQGTVAAHVVGLRDIDGVGRGGAEEAFDRLLRGSDGQRRMVRDARGYVIEVLEEVTQPPRHGETVVLTIDSVVQLIAERQLDVIMREWSPHSACAIVLDPRTGEVLAMASRPTFDPNAPGRAVPDAWSNRALSAVFEPGSTIKPCIVAWAIERGVLDPDEEIDCGRGAYRMNGRVLHDHHPYGVLSVGDILVKSSNIGMARIGERLSNERLHNAVTGFGFGSRTGIELPGELPGTVRPLEDWTPYSTGSIPMGQELACTPLQVIAAHAVLANGGRRVTPHVLSRAPGSGTRLHRPSGEQVLSEATAAWIVRGPMRDVVERGTGRRARIDGLAIFGKSGTAQKIDPASGGYSSDRHVCSFVCGAPAENPELLVLVSVDEPSAPGTHQGGAVAAPAAAAILRDALSYLGPPTRIATTLPGNAHDEGMQ